MHVLIVEDDRLFQRELRLMVEELDGVTSVDVAGDAAAALEALEGDPAPALALLDVFMPRREGETETTPEGAELARRARELLPEVRLVILTSLDRQAASDLLGGGVADDFLTKDSPVEEIEARIACQVRAARKEQADLGRAGLRAGSGVQELVGSSSAMQEVREWLRRAAATSAPVLLTGESGTGKELAAWTLHRLSPWARGPFLPFNAAAVGEGLLESELFGHRKGAFTGATADRAGVVESAEGGTLFLDEIGELPLAFQVKLLRFLDTGTFHRLGEDRPRRARVRLVFATHRDLSQEVAEGRFREDLRYRLDVLHLVLPPLRTRKEDLVPLARFLAAQLAAGLGTTTPEVGEEVVEVLASHAWPGNVRELRNVLERAMILTPGHRLEVAAVREALPSREPPAAPGSGHAAPAVTETTPPCRPDVTDYQPGAELKATMEEAERRFLEGALRHHGGNVSATARAIGIARRTLQEKMARHGLR